MTLDSKSGGFTLIELVMVMMLLAILAAVAIPSFLDFRVEAKNAATHGALGAFRSAIAIAGAAIQLKEEDNVPRYPTYDEMSANSYDSSHPVLSGEAILDRANDIPFNPWSRSTATVANRKRIFDCGAIAKGALLSPPNQDQGWCYNENTGQFWANSDRNGGISGEVENEF